VRENFLSIYKTLEDLKKTAIIDRSLPANGLSLVVKNLSYSIDKLSLRIVANSQRTIENVEHQLLGNDTLLSSSRVGDLDLTIVQRTGGQAQPSAKSFSRQQTPKSVIKRKGSSSHELSLVTSDVVPAGGGAAQPHR
jgi:hypothetical protein